MASATADAIRARLIATLRPEWIAAQRWMRAKQRVVVDVRPDDLVPLGPEGMWLATLTVRYQDESEERYAHLVTVRGQEVREPHDGDGAWQALARLTLAGGELAGARGVVRSTPTAAGIRLPAVGGTGQARPSERRLGVEQSNTSVVLDDRLMVKLYRLLEPGDHPEPEVGAFLAAAGFKHAPAFLGSATYVDEAGASCAVAMTQAYLPNAGDAWTTIRQALASAAGAERAIEEIAQIGELTAALHAALASQPANPAFPARLATSEERAAWRHRAEGLLEGALAALPAPERHRLARVVPAIADRLAILDRHGPARICRIHGDYHLGQLLRTADGFAVIDFEGEPARPLHDRRQPASPLRDVAGMLRSLDYAARTAARADSAGVDPDAWLARARSAFLTVYGPLDPEEADLLVAFEIEKACYEVGYEAGSRPDWTWLPLSALERMVG